MQVGEPRFHGCGREVWSFCEPVISVRVVVRVWVTVAGRSQGYRRLPATLVG